ncbi:hypothetical protein JYQ62_19710 [Nostoc sp. UHCC 0702]|nr:hypothetical protein JYQ62_19710 [Nostoc sp. UHCC 0702]
MRKSCSSKRDWADCSTSDKAVSRHFSLWAAATSSTFLGNPGSFPSVQPEMPRLMIAVGNKTVGS